MLIAQDGSGLVFCVEEQVASLSPAFPNRWRAVLAGGGVAYLPGNKPDGPWVPSGKDWVLPQLLRPTATGWEDPDGFPYAAAEWGEVILPAPPPAPDLPCLADEIWALDDKGWHTDRGPLPCPLPLDEAARLHPDLRRARPRLYFNPRRLRRIPILPNGSAALTYDNGRQHKLERRWHRDLCQTLGLKSLTHLEPFVEGLFRIFLRDFPFELARAPAEVLKHYFATSDELTANLIWQARHYKSLGMAMGYGKDHGGFCYFPLAPALERAGFLKAAHDLRVNGPKFTRFQVILAELIGQDQLFTFEDLGFEDQGQNTRLIGTSLPEVILVAEKGSVGQFCRELALKHGLSLFIAGGVPKLVSVEFFARALRKVYSGPVFVIALVDWDPGGHRVATTMGRHLRRYGFETPADPVFLMRPETFSDEELALFAMTLRGDTPAELTTIQKWVEGTGGIHGQPRGIYCNCLHPLDRVVPTLEHWLQIHGRTPR